LTVVDIRFVGRFQVEQKIAGNLFIRREIILGPFTVIEKIVQRILKCQKNVLVDTGADPGGIYRNPCCKFLSTGTVQHTQQEHEKKVFQWLHVIR
jgi:hypothetical protein